MKWLLMIPFFFSILYAQSIANEYLGNTSYFMITYPYSQLQVSNDETDANTHEITIDVFQKDTIFLHKAWQTCLTNPTKSKLDSQLYPIPFSVKLEPGDYTVRISILHLAKNFALKKEFKVTIEKSSSQIGRFSIIAKIGKLPLYPNQYTTKLKADTLFLVQNFSECPDSIRLLFKSKHEYASFTIPPSSNLQYQVPDSLHTLNPQDFKLKLYFKDQTVVHDYNPFSRKLEYIDQYKVKDQLAQMHYILNQNEWSYFKKIPDNELQKEIDYYWKTHDPNPLTPYNENQEIFYDRILYSDKHFSFRNYKKGWQTDRGRIYIKLGSPDEIIEEAFQIGKYPVIIWNYQSLNKQYIFYDIKGFGDYELKDYDFNY